MTVKEAFDLIDKAVKLICGHSEDETCQDCKKIISILQYLELGQIITKYFGKKMDFSKEGAPRTVPGGYVERFLGEGSVERAHRARKVLKKFSNSSIPEDIAMELEKLTVLIEKHPEI